MLTNPTFRSMPMKVDPVDTFLPFENRQLDDLINSGTFHHVPAIRIPPVSNDNRTDIIAVLSAANVLLRSYWMHMSDVLRTGLLKQTNAVLDLDDWEDDDCNASLDSYKTLLRSIVELQPNRRPALGLSDRGNFLAAWHREASKVVIEFLPNDRMKWMIAQAEGADTDRAAGQTNVAQIRMIMEVHAGRALVDGEE